MALILSGDPARPREKRVPRHVVPMADWSPRVHDPSVQAELRMALTSAIDELPVAYRAVLVLRDVEGRSNSEIAGDNHRHGLRLMTLGPAGDAVSATSRTSSRGRLTDLAWMRRDGWGGGAAVPEVQPPASEACRTGEAPAHTRRRAALTSHLPRS